MNKLIFKSSEDATRESNENKKNNSRGRYKIA